MTEIIKYISNVTMRGGERHDNEPIDYFRQYYCDRAENIIQDGLTRAREPSEADSEQEFQMSLLSEMMTGMGLRALEAGKLEQADMYLDGIVSLKDVISSRRFVESVVGLGIPAEAAGSVLAQEKLDEVFRISGSKLGWKLGQIGRVCAARGIPADKWIRRYTAESKELEWVGYMQYYAAASQRPDGEIYEAMADQKALELFVDGKYGPNLIIEGAGLALHCTRNPDIRKKIVDYFRLAIDYPETPIEFSHMLKTCNMILRDKDLATDTVVMALAGTIEKHTKYFDEKGIPVLFMTPQLSFWHQALASHRRNGPGNGEDDSSDSAVRFHIKNNDFASAGQLLGTAPDVKTLAYCLQQATELGHVDELLPEEVINKVPILSSAAQFAKSRINAAAGDERAVEELERIGIACAETYDTQQQFSISQYIKNQYIEEAFTVLQGIDTQRAVAYAKKILALDEQAGHVMRTHKLVDGLIRSGDSETLLRASRWAEPTAAEPSYYNFVRLLRELSILSDDDDNDMALSWILPDM